ncbi:MAG: hypothetical protein JWP77_2672 [Polaromonas sp.]|nr:hypothetical protein [Polaromonas sp.]
MLIASSMRQAAFHMSDSLLIYQLGILYAPVIVYPGSMDSVIRFAAGKSMLHGKFF